MPALPTDEKVMLIPLTQNKFVLVDDEDYGWLSETSWQYHRASTGYAWSGNQPMHRQIMERHGMHVEGLVTDHRNGWGLDNRKGNLRMVSQAENNANGSGNRGVKRKPNGWEAQIGREYLGKFATRQEAEDCRILAEASRGWLTTAERRVLERQLLLDLDELAAYGLIIRVSDARRLEDRYACYDGSLFQQRVAANAEDRLELAQRRATAQQLQQQRRSFLQTEYRAGEQNRRQEARHRLSDLNRQVYFHAKLGWRVRLPEGEISVPSRQAGLDLL